MPLFTRPAAGPSATVLARSPLPPAVLMPRVAEYPLPSMFRRWAVFPGIDRVDGQEGTWDRVGGSRTIRLSDGGSVVETLVEHRTGSSFAYELIGFTDVFGRVVRGVRGEWSFAPDGDGSVVRWTWEFAARPGRRALVALLVVPAYRRNMERMIRAAVAAVSVP